MILLAGFFSDAPSEPNAEQVWRLLARQHSQAGQGDRAEVRTAGGFALGASGSATICAGRANRNLQLVADARLDGRAELRAALGGSPDASDPELIMAAWERWGAAAPHHLYGDYAFVLWDAEARRLSLVRDALGQRPLFFLPDGSAFASRADAFDVLNARHGLPCEDALAAHLAFVSAGPKTCYEGVERVRPGELVTIEGGQTVREQYWRPSVRPDHRRSAADTIAECRHLLDAAVAGRVSDAKAAIATHLSAGLDSSVATALTSRLRPAEMPIHAFTAVPASIDGSQGRLTDESAQAAVAAAALPGVRHQLVRARDDPLLLLAKAKSLYQQPLPNPHNHGWVAAINDAARDSGAGILLIGQTGNYSFSMGGDRHRHLKRAAKAVRGAFRHAPPLFPLLSTGGLARTGDDPPPGGGAERRLHFLLRLDPGAFFKGIEAEWGLDTRDPFADRRLVEFSLTVPEQMLARFGDRGLGRPIAEQLLPAGFVNNRARGYQSADWIARLRRHAPVVRALIERGRELEMAGRLLHLEAVAAAGDRLESPAAAGPADERLYRVDLPRGLAVIAFIDALDGPKSRVEPSAWQGARL